MKYSKLFWAIVCLAKILIIWKKSRILKDNQDISIESLVRNHSVFDGITNRNHGASHACGWVQRLN